MAELRWVFEENFCGCGVRMVRRQLAREGDCQEFRVRVAIVDSKEVPDGTTQSAPHLLANADPKTAFEARGLPAAARTRSDRQSDGVV
jgi:hypothetical protein